MPSCLNCGTPLVGAYCHACGQGKVDPNTLAIRPFFAQLADELAHLEFKSVRTLIGVLRPGYLPDEFLAGRRTRYLGPLKLYFLAAALFFFAAPYVAGFNLQTLMEDPDTSLPLLVQRRLAVTHMDFPMFAARFNLRLQTVYTLSVGVSMIGIAAILGLLYRRARLPFGTHVVFALYYTSFFYLAALVVGVVNQAAGRLSPLAFGAMIYDILIPYMFLALRRVYGESAAWTAAKCAALLVFAFLLDSPINIAAVRLTIALT